MNIQAKANKLKYIKNNLEISLHLSQILHQIYQDEYLKKSMILKGGTAVQLYLENVKRLFFDLDMDFILKLDERKQFQTYLINYMDKLGYKEVSPKSRFSYSLDSYCFPYYLENGNLDYLKLDINYSCAPHLYPTIPKKVENDDFELHQTIWLVHIEELMGMKIASLQESGQIKDLFDIYQVLNSNLDIKIENVQNAYLFYMVLADCYDKIEKLNNIESITNRDERSKLYPLIPKKSSPNLELMKREVLSYVKECSILNQSQKKFIKTFQEGNYHPEYLFFKEQTIINAQNNPIAKWKLKMKSK